MTSQIKFFSHSELDKSKWDECILNSTKSLPYAQSWYLDVVSPNWNAVILGNYDFVMPLTHRKKIGIEYLHQPYFTQQLGIFSKHEITVDVANAFVNDLVERYKFIEINFNYGNSNSIKQLQNNSKTTWYKRVTHHLDLNLLYDDLAKNYNDQRLRNLKKANQNDLVVKVENDFDWLTNMFHENKREILKPKDYALLKRLIQTSQQHQAGTIYSVAQNNERLGGAFILHNEHYVINLFNVSNERGRQTQAMTFLIDHLLKKYSGTNRIFDFEGSQINSISQFYASFGATPVNYWMLKHDGVPWYVRTLKQLKNKL